MFFLNFYNITMNKTILCITSLFLLKVGFCQQEVSFRLGLPLGHTDEVNSALFSPGENFILTVSNDNTAKLWDSKNGKLLQTFNGHKASVHKGIFSPDANWVVTSSYDNTIKLWECKTGKMLHSYDLHSDIIRSMEFSSDGKTILTASDDHTAKLWDCITGRLLFSFDGHTAGVWYATFSPGENTVLTASSDGSAKLWSKKNGTLIHSFNQHADRIHSALFSADGNTILTASNDATSKLWDAKTGKLIHSLNGHLLSVNTAMFSPDGNNILTASDDGTAKIWHVKTGKIIHSLVGHTGGVGSAKFSPDGKTVLTHSYKPTRISEYGDNSAKLWDCATGKQLHSFDGHYDMIYSAEFSPDGQKALTFSRDYTMKLWDCKSGKMLQSMKGNWLRFYSAKFSSNGRSILTASFDRTAKLWDCETGKVIHSFQGFTHSFNSGIFSPDGKYILNASDDGSSKVWDYQKGELLHSLYGHQADVLSATFSPEGSTILSDGRDGLIKLWEHPTGKLLNSFNATKAWFNYDGKSILTSLDGTAKLWEYDTGKLLQTFEGLSETIYSAEFNRDGTRVIIDSDDHAGFTKIWNCRTGEMLQAFDQSAVFSPDGRFVLTIWNDTSAIIWDVVVKKGILSLKGHKDKIYGALFSPDGKTILTTSADSSAKLWDFSTGNLLYSFAISNSWYYPKFSPDGKTILTTTGDTIKVWSLTTGKMLDLFKGSSTEFSPNGQFVLFKDDQVKYWDSQTNKMNVLSDQLTAFAHAQKFSPRNSSDPFGGKYLLTTGSDHRNILWETKTGKLISQMFLLFDNEPLILIPSGHYMATQKAASKLYYIKGLQTIGFDQLDIKYNRPDKVLSALGEAFGNPDTALIRSYHRAWLKRVQKLGIDTTGFEEGFSAPESDFLNRAQIEYDQKGNQLTLLVWGKDADYLLDRYNVWVNEVPVFGQRGINIRKQNLNELHTSVTLTLSEGDNKIETSVLNINGIESYRVPLYVRYNPLQSSPEKLHFVGIGVDRYQQPGHNLQYSAKDIRDLATQLKTKYASNISIDTLFDENVTRENILALKMKLKQTTVNDKVIISFSGHGLLDSKFDYYLATHAVDFKNPSVSGLAYEDLEWLLDSIPARKKLLLMDACHSGEVDKEELMAMNTTKPEGTKGAELVYEYQPTLGMKNSFELMQELFTNVNRGTGATIISAAGGTQFAYEKGNLQNGVFTYSILELMQQQKQIKVSELKTKVGERVTELTNGLQKPTSRNETIELDWRVW